MRVYISGKIGEEVISEATRQKFEKAQKMLLAKGYKVVDPACEKYQMQMDKEVEIEKKKWIEAGYGEKFDRYTHILLWDMHILSMCDAIYLLSDWWDSDGARTEKDFATATKKQFFFQSKIEAMEHAGSEWCHEFLLMPPSKRSRSAHIDKLKRDFINKRLNEIWLPTEIK